MFFWDFLLTTCLFRVGFYNQEKEFDERGLDLKTTKFQQGNKLKLIYLTCMPWCAYKCFFDAYIYF